MIYKDFYQIKKLNFEFLIIGSGPAGISVALKLEEKKLIKLYTMLSIF